jgi:L-ribulokinase
VGGTITTTRSGSDNGPYVVGVDFGTLSGRALVVRASDGEELGSAVHEYAHGVIDGALPRSGEKLAPSWALQDPGDWLEVLRNAVPAAVRASDVDPADVAGIATAFTASTPLPVLADGTPLCCLEEFELRPHAYPKLWRHHAAQEQADRITALAVARREPWLARYGGRISSEWEFAKALQVLEEDPEIYAATERWIEAADWIVWQLCGDETRNACTAGYKGIFQDGRYPSEDYLRALDEAFAGFVAEKLEHPLAQLGARAGGLTGQAARWTGLSEGTAVAVGNVDAHVTAPAARAIEPGHMLAVMGTSICHVMNGDRLTEVPGMCGVVDGGITPGLFGYEAGQSGVGDIFGWFVEQQVPPGYYAEAERRGISVHRHLSELASTQDVGRHGLIALDWHSGNRSVLVDHELSGVLVGATLATRPEDIYRALIEATAFGTRKIIDTFERHDVPVQEFTVAGGLLKNPLVMQIYADVLRRPLHMIESEEGPALGAAMHAAVAAGLHPDIKAAATAMGRARRDAYTPDEENADAYDQLYLHYSELHDYFGRGAMMHELRRPGHATRRSSDVIAELRRLVCRLHAELPKHGLVAWTSGNLSARVPGQDLMVIKASGVDFDTMTPETVVVCDLFGALVEGSMSPSSDAATHGYIYRHMPEVGAVAHTHSAYATAFAATGEPIPCVLTAMADEFGGEIPIGPFARIGDEEIGRGIVETLAGHRSPAVLMQSHGVFTLGATPRDAIKAAVMCEDVARTAHLARTLGDPVPLRTDDIDALYDRYQNVYGQR